VLRLRGRRPARHVALVLVDEEALRREAWPWSRRRLAALVDAARASGARGVVLDVLLPEEREGDGELARALRASASVLAVGVDDRDGWLLPAPPLRNAASPGHVSFETDRDGVVRRFRATLQLADRSFPALALAGARLADPSLAVAVGASVRPGFAATELPRVGAASLLDGPRAELAGRVVFIGASAAGVGDRVVSPASRHGIPEPGVVVQAEACESILDRDLLRPASPLVSALLSAAAALLAALATPASGYARALAAALLPLPVAALLLGTARLEVAGVTAAAAALAVTAADALRAFARQRRQVTLSERRVRELSAVADELRAGRSDDAEARRVVAHELRTPLTSVKGLAQLLADFDLSEEERRRVAGLLASETSRLSEMVETLLDLERMKLRDFRASATRVALSELVERRAEVMRRGSRRTLRLALEPGVDVLGDAALLERVIENLVGNALKFSPEDTEVELRLSRTSGSAALLEVADRGPGIPPEDRRRVFQRFARSPGAALAPGLGLGLAFVAEIAAWHGGEVEALENPGGGSLFRVMLPMAS